MSDKGPIHNVMSNYQSRQERVQRMVPIIWIGVLLLVTAAGFLILRSARPAVPPLAETPTETPDPAETPAPADSPDATAIPGGTQAPALAETPAESPTITPTIVASHTVRDGETLSGIAAFLGVDVLTLMAMNPSVTPEFLNVGDTILVPGRETGPAATAAPGETAVIEYQVVAGDTLAAIALRFGSTIEAIVQENNLESADQIREGQTLRIPVTPGVSSPGTPTQPGPQDEPTVTPTQ